MTNYRVDPSFPASKPINIPLDNVQVNQYYSLADMQMGDYAGTTETDSKTAPKSGGYTNINGR